MFFNQIPFLNAELKEFMMLMHKNYLTYVKAATIVQSASMQILANSFSAWSQSFWK